MITERAADVSLVFCTKANEVSAIDECLDCQPLGCHILINDSFQLSFGQLMR